MAMTDVQVERQIAQDAAAAAVLGSAREPGVARGRGAGIHVDDYGQGRGHVLHGGQGYCGGDQRGKDPERRGRGLALDGTCCRYQ